MLRSCLFIVASVVLLGLVAAGVKKEDMYSDKYDDISIDLILENRRLREQYFNCFMGTAPCRTADAAFYRDVFPEALATNCRRCTEKGKINLDKTVTWYLQNKPEDFNALVRKIINGTKKKDPNAEIELPPQVQGSVQ